MENTIRSIIRERLRSSEEALRASGWTQHQLACALDGLPLNEAADRADELLRALPQVRITWNGAGGELDSVTVAGDASLNQALKRLIGSNIVSPGDTFEVREVE